MFAILVLLGLTVFVFGFIQLLFSVFKRKPKKKSLTALGVGFLMLTVGVAITPPAGDIPSPTAATGSVAPSSHASTVSRERHEDKESELDASQPQELTSSEQPVSSQIVPVPAVSIAHGPLPKAQPYENEAEIVPQVENQPQNLPDTPAEQLQPRGVAKMRRLW